MAAVNTTYTDFAEDVEWMLRTGETNAEAIARRVRLSPRSLDKKLRRAGRGDLCAQIVGLGWVK